MIARGELALAIRLARRELRTGLRGFGVFLACLALGVAAVAGVRSLAAGHQAAMARDAAALLGGDLEAAVPQRPADPGEWAALNRIGRLSHLVSMRVMVRRDQDGARRELAALRAVDQAYPLYGGVTLDPPMPLAQALADRDGLPGAAASPELLTRLGVGVGDVIRVADAPFVVRAVLVRAPDAASGLGNLAALGPPLLVSEQALAASGLLGPGMLTRHAYRLKLPPGADATGAAEALRQTLTTAGWRVRDAARAQPGVARFLDRLTAVMSLVGLAALLLGGIGISRAVSGYLDERTATIAAMKCLGSPGRLVTWTYLLAVLTLAAAGIGLGLAIGALLPALAAPVIGAAGQIRPLPGPFPGALALAGLFGLLTVLAFSLAPLARAARISPLILFRGQAGPDRLRQPLASLLPAGACLAALAGLTVVATPDRWLGLGFVVCAAVGALLFFWGGRLATRLVRLLPAGHPGLWSLTLRSLGRPDNRRVGQTLVALGLGLSTLCAMGQVHANVAQALSREIPDQAPDFFFLDIQPEQLTAFADTIRAMPGATNLDISPMTRGRVTRLAGQVVEESRIAEDVRWVARSDRGLTMATTMPQGTRLTAGAWWPPDYAGPPLVSVEEKAAEGMGLALGDTVTFHVLDRDITARVASLRRVDWLGLGINFVFVLSPGSLGGVPLTYLATVHVDRSGPDNPAEALYRAVTDRFPGITAIGVGEALAEVATLADKVATAVAAAAATTLAAGILVLLQTMAAQLRHRAYEAVVFKVCGATRRDIMTVLVLENALVGLLAGVMALILGTTLAWVFVTEVTELPFHPYAGQAVATVGLAALLTVSLGLTGIWRLLGRKAWPSLRNE
jgi:putative ABC transport system permease protein